MSTTTRNTTSGTVELASLLAAWNRHQQLRSSGADIAELYASRVRLDEARLAARAALAA